jgi:hypothetical protein
VMAVFQHLVQLAVEFEGHAIAQFVDIDHGTSYLRILVLGIIAAPTWRRQTFGWML